MNLIFSADQNWGIGRANELLYRVPGDMKFFREKTTGNVVVMGRKTLESLPGGKPLGNRQNVVLTRDPAFRARGAAVLASLPALFEHLDQYDDKSIFIIGGAQVYRQLMPYCSAAYVTRWESVAEADSFVPDLDADPAWSLAEQSRLHTETGVSYRYCTYVQQEPRPWRPGE